MQLTASTRSVKPADAPKDGARWLIVDAEGKSLGRIAVRISNALRGKDKPTYTSHVDTGAFVVVINAAKVNLTGAKFDQKVYYRHSGYIGHLRTATAREIMEKNPEELIKKAVTGMLPGNKLARAMITKLKIYAGAEHPHVAQNPQTLEV
jgi:large subunit ribosomal protein L13